MSFVGVAIGSVASIGGALIGAKSQKRAGDQAAAGAERDIEFQRESRDLARGDQKPYREAGYTALDALMSMTGLGGTGGGTSGGGASKRGASSSSGQYGSGGRNGLFVGLDNNIRSNSQGRRSAYSRFDGGAIGAKNLYNINEMGPENVYSDGAMSRNPNPMTIDGKTGYVQPNIQGRYMGGAMGGAVTASMGDEFPGGAYVPPNQVPPTQGDGLFGGQLGRARDAAGGGAAVNPGIANGGVMENPGGQEGGYNFMTDPGYNFRFNEGMRGLERGAAARGGLLSGGFARKAIGYGQGMASNEYSNVYNRISNIAGLGQVSTGQSGQYAMMAGQGMGNSASNAANASAYGTVGAGNAWANAGNQIAQLPWGQVFGSPGGGNQSSGLENRSWDMN